MLCGACNRELVASEQSSGICYVCTSSGGSTAAAREIVSAKERVLTEKMAGIILTTETYPAGLEIKRRIEIVTAECAFGMNVFRDFFAGMTDFFGGRSQATQNVLRDARRRVLQELRHEAFESGANAVIGVTLNYSEISGKDKSMLLVVACGTAVEVAEQNEPPRKG